ncbi:MAG: hypothetical protein AAGG55_04235 [Pseudomonadota bacterium]
MTEARENAPLRILFWISLGSALLPFVAVHGAYWLSASTEIVPWCFPYIESCTSISATGRHAPGSFVFRGLMLPSAMLMLVLWVLHGHALKTLGASRRRSTALIVLGAAACIGLTLYVTVLGEIGDLWRLQRKIGTVLFFSFTFLAQVLLAASLRDAEKSSMRGARRTGQRMLRVCQLMLTIGIISVAINIASEDLHDRIEDAVEWQLALLLQLNFLLLALFWRQSNWVLAFQRSDTH